jgi:two-component system phosphate regulon sensor histidine kinase PhoR
LLNSRILVAIFIFATLLFALYYFTYINLIAFFILLLSFAVCVFLFSLFYYSLKNELSTAINIINSLGTPYQTDVISVQLNSLQKLHNIAFALNSLSDRLERRDKQRRQYAARLRLQNKQSTEVIEAIGHEFKNPISAIMGYTQTLMEDTEIDSKLLVKFLDKIYNNANSISNMVDRLALAAKLESNMLTPNIVNVALKPLVEDVVSQFALKYKKAEFIINCDDYDIMADKTMLRLILTNLIDNACKYGGMQVLIESIRTNASITLSVSDKGQGIARDDLGRLTQKFYRVRQNGWDNSLGLGLAIVDYLLKLHNSKLNLQSELGKGSVFSFELSLYNKSNYTT